MSKTFDIPIICKMTVEDLTDQIITAFEGGISYWCNYAEAGIITNIDDDGAYEFEPMKDRLYSQWRHEGCGPYTNPEFWACRSHGYRLTDTEEGRVVPTILTAERVARAISELLSSHTKIGARLLVPGDADALDADCMVQQAVFGGIVYG